MVITHTLINNTRTHVLILSCARTKECGRSNGIMEPRIFGGKETEPHQYPWTVFIGIAGHGCTGSLLSDRTVLSAGHCVYGYDYY